MSSPRCFDLSFCPINALYTDASISDVESGGVGIISTLRTLLVTNLSWTEPSTALFKSPVDTDSRFMDILCTRISATVIEFRVRDQNANTICTRRIQITAGNAITYLTGKYFCIVIAQQATPQVFRAYLLDKSPDGQADDSLYVVANGWLTGASADDGNGKVAFKFFAMDSGVATAADRGRALYSTDNSNVVEQVMHSGTILYMDPLIHITYAGTRKWAGRLPQTFATKTDLGGGTTKAPAVDDAAYASFYVLPLNRAGTHAPLEAVRSSL